VALQSQIINGNTYQIGSPEWYAAQQADIVQRAGVGGTAGGTAEANYLDKLTPSLAGLYSATGAYPYGTSAGGGSTPPNIGYPAGGGANFNAEPVSSGGLTSDSGTPANMPATVSINPTDVSAADTAAFATAKDEAAQTAAASMRGLQGALASRGMGGAGYEAGQIGNTLAQESNTIGAAGRAQAEKDAELQAQAAIANLNAGVAERGQTIGAGESAADRAAGEREAAFSGGVAERGQTLGSEEAAANLSAQQAQNAYTGAVTQRAQDIQQQETAAQLAEEQAALKSNQSLAILRSVLGGGGPVSPAYVY